VHVPVHGVIENTVKPYKSGLSVFPDVLEAQGYTCFLIGKSHFIPVPASYAFTDIHNGNTDKRCDYAPYADGSCEYYDEDDFLESYLVDSFEKNIGAFLDSKDGNGENPFFAHLSFVSPHPPSTPPTEPINFANMYAPSDLPPLNYVNGDVGLMPYQTQMLLGLLPRDGKPNWILPDGSPNMTTVDAERLLYYGLCSYVDEQLGRAVNFVDERNLTHSTLIIFTADHGSLLFAHGGPNDKHSFYAEAWRVPLIFRWSGTLPQNVTAGFASTVDVTASILVAAGVDWEGAANMHAEDFTDASLPNNTMFMAGLDILTPLMDYRFLEEGKTFGFAEIATPRTAIPATEYRGYGVVSERWKLLYFPENGEGRLFDRTNDSQERHDLFANPTCESVKGILLVGLLRWRAQQDDLQWELAQWSSGADVGARARNDSYFLTGRAAEFNLQAAAVQADALWFASGLCDILS
jgi:arylsulfatase A-like enzyme